MIGRCSDEAITASVRPTLRALYGADGGPWARATIAQLVGLLDHADRRGNDPEPRRRAELEAALDAAGSPPAGSPYERAAALLAAAVGGDPVAASGRDAVRRLLVAQLDDELASVGGLLAAFRGRLPDA